MACEVVRAWHGVNLVWNDYVYKKDRLYRTNQHWRCTVSGCLGRLHTDLADPPVVGKNVQHNHIADEELARSRKTKDELCTAAQQRPLVPLSNLYNCGLLFKSVFRGPIMNYNNIAPIDHKFSICPYRPVIHLA